eukprot:2597270-Pyramimonas_sp.AAC.1
MEWAVLVPAALTHGFPPVMLGLELQTCAGPRLLDHSDAVPCPCQGARSIIQDIRIGARFAKVVANMVMSRLN